MPGQQILEPNPPPDSSQLPDALLEYRVKLDVKGTLSGDELEAVSQFRRAADYIAAGTYASSPCTYNALTAEWAQR